MNPDSREKTKAYGYHIDKSQKNRRPPPKKETEASGLCFLLFGKNLMIFRIAGTDVYLVGSIHLVPAGITLSLEKQSALLEEAHEVIFESDLDHTSPPANRFFESGRLSAVIPRPLFERVVSLAEEIGFEEPAQAESIRCSRPGVDFEIKEQKITSFYAQSSVSSPDLANGYSLTCVQHIGKFSQTKTTNGYVLSFSETDDQYGESKNCTVRIEDSGLEIHLYTTACVSECLKFNYQIEKKGNDCRIE